MGMTALVVKFFPSILSVMDVGNMFVIFGAAGILLLVLGTCFIPENRGLSLAKVEVKSSGIEIEEH